MSAALAVVIVSYQSRPELPRTLASVAREAPQAEVVVVDNASRDGSAEAARATLPAALVLANDTNAGFSRANNQGVRATRAPFVLLLNPDCELRPGAVRALLARASADPRLGALGPRTLNEDGTVQVSTGPMLTPWAEWAQQRLVRGVKRGDPAARRRAAEAHAREHEPAWVSGACMLLRREAFEAVQGFDEGFFLYEEDVDLCVRLRAAGWRVLFLPEAEVVHHLGRSMASEPRRSSLEYHRSHLYFYRKHLGWPATAALRFKLLVQGLAGRDRHLLRIALAPARHA